MRIKLKDGHILTVPDGSSEEEIQRRIKEYQDSQRTTDVGEALTRGFYKGVGAIPGLGAGAVGLVENLIPGQQKGLEAVEANLQESREYWEEKAPGESDTLAEKVLEGLGRAPGEIATIIPFGVAAAPLRGVAGLGAALARPALVFGTHGAVMHGGEGLRSSAAHGLRGAAEGAAFGGTGRLAGKIMPEATTLGANVLRRMAHGAGAGGVVGTAAKLEGQPTEDALAAGITMGALGLALPVERGIDTRAEALRGLKKEVRDKVKSGEITVEEAIEAKPGEFIPEKPVEFTPPEGRGTFIESDLEAAGQTARRYQDMTKAGQAFYDTLGLKRMLREEQAKGEFVPRTNEDISFRAANELLTDAEGRPLASPENIDALTYFVENSVAESGKLSQQLRRKIRQAKANNDPRYDEYMEQYEAVKATLPAQLMMSRGIESAVSNAMRIIGVARRNTPEWMRAAKVLEKKGIFDKDLKFKDDVMELLELSEGHPELTARITKAFDTPTLWEYFQEYWINGLLSGFPTHVVNVTSNQTMLGLDMIEKRAALFAETKVADPITKKKLSVEDAKGEWDADVRGARAAIGPALRTAWRMIKSEDYDITADYPRWAALQRGQGKTDYRTKVIGGKAGQAVRLPTRFLGAMDMFSKIIAGERYGHSTAYRIAAQEIAAGKIGRGQLLERKKQLLGLGDKPVDRRVLKSMKDNAARLSFTEKPGPGMAKAMKVRDVGIEVPILGEIKPGVFLVPFMSTPWNVIRQSIKRSPLNIINMQKLHRKYKSGDITPQQYWSEVAATSIGTTITASLVALANAGYLTGGGPVNPADRMNKIAQGWKPYSFRIPLGDRDHYVSIQRIEPLGTVLGMAGDIAEMGDADDKFGKMTAAIKDNLTNKTFLMGLENFAAFVHNPQQFGSQYLRQSVGSLVPTLAAKTAQAIDPYARRVDPTGTTSGVPDAMLYRMPFLSQELPGKSTIFGEPAERWSFSPTTLDTTEGKIARAAMAMVSPGTAGVTTPDKAVEVEFDRLSKYEGMPPSMPQKRKRLKLRGVDGTLVELNEDDYKVYDRYHAMAKKHLASIIKSPNWAAYPDALKAALLRKTYQKYRNAATKEVNDSIRRRTSVGE
jgi:hypothetical protein